MGLVEVFLERNEVGLSGERADISLVVHRELRLSLSLALQHEGEGGQRSHACEGSGESGVV
jgi:hypothetical protein